MRTLANVKALLIQVSGGKPLTFFQRAVGERFILATARNFIITVIFEIFAFYQWRSKITAAIPNCTKKNTKKELTKFLLYDIVFIEREVINMKYAVRIFDGEFTIIYTTEAKDTSSAENKIIKYHKAMVGTPIVSIIVTKIR